MAANQAAWLPYVNNLKGVTAAGLIGPGPALYAVHPEGALQLTGDHYNALITAKQQGPANLHASGLTVNGTKFMFLRPQDDCFLFRCGQTGIVAGVSNQLVLVAYYGEGVNAAEPLDAVQKVISGLIAANM